MKIAVYDGDGSKSFFEDAAGLNVVEVTQPFDADLINSAEAFFNFDPGAGAANYSSVTVPVFINSMSEPLSAFAHGSNVVRINTWPGFSVKDIWEAAGELSRGHHAIANAFGKKLTAVPDLPGFLSARTVAMVINEAFFALGEGVSSEEEIDTAMKLGTNYPYGPFEWARQIGFSQIERLLLALSKDNSKYSPAPALSAATKSS